MSANRRISAVAATACLFVMIATAQENAADAALMRAIEQSDLAAVERALKAGANVNAGGTSGTPLMQSAICSTAACMRLLLDRGADPNAANQAGSTALMWSAADAGKIRVLLDKGASVNAQANSGRTALSVAASSAGNIEGVKLLLARGADAKMSRALTVCAAAGSGDEAILQAVLAAGGNPNERLPNGMTPLMLASRDTKPGSVKHLLDAGADVNAKSNTPRPTIRGLAEQGELTPLMRAASFSNAEVVRLLLDRGADVKAADFRGMTPLMMAAASEFQDRETVRLLIAAGSDVEAVAKDGQTVASWAEKWGAGGVFKLLGRPGANATILQPAKLLDKPLEPTIRGAAEKAIRLLQSSSTEYFAKSGCAGCHHQMLTGMAVGLARQRGLQVSERIAQEQLKTQILVKTPEREALLLGMPIGGAPMADSLLLVSLAAQAYPADTFTAALTHFLAGFQSEDGAWRGPTVRQPLQYSAFSNTAYAIRALQFYAPAGRRQEYSSRVERARAWLLSHNPVVNEDRVKQLLGLMWAGAKANSLRTAVSQLLAEQGTDGGWSQRPGFPSDAYATGQTLYALNQAGGVPANHAAYVKGVAFLRRTQLEDGSWHVRSRSVKFQPYFESGFPHGHDQWISATASAWAAMALTLAVEAPVVASR
jgi:ankyrin repeat protein